VRESFVCINASPDAVNDVFTELKTCKEVKEAFKVFGVYDIIAVVSGERIEDLSNFIETRIKHIDNVLTTFSMLMLRPDDFTRKNEVLTV
jgi:DNA-binding Lrp family transcriptional regulator